MSVINKISPVKRDHSIKEASITLFLATPIIKAERFKQLIEGQLKDKFQQFQLLSQVEIQFQGDQQAVINNQSARVNSEGGFRFLAFEKGQMVKILQGVNEHNRNYISFHSFNYNRWEGFFQEYMEILNSLFEYQNELFISAIGIHYLDEFNWLSQGKPELNLIFKEGNFLPKEFFNSDVSNYTFVTEKVEDNVKYFDRLNIAVNTKVQSLVNISHNVTQPLVDVLSLRDLLLLNGDFKKRLTGGHERNKLVLKDILTESIQEMIKLT